MDTALIEKPNDKITPPYLPPSLRSQYNVSGNNNTFNERVDTQIIIHNHTSSTSRTVNSTRCNIFVLNGKNFTTGGCFSVLKSRANVNGVDVSGITTYPSLFVNPNDGYTKCSDTSQQFYYGFVTKLEDEQHSIKVCYELKSTQPLLQSHLNAAVKKLGISPIKGKDVLGETGWTIHPVDIYQALTDEGLNLTAY